MSHEGTTRTPIYISLQKIHLGLFGGIAYKSKRGVSASDKLISKNWKDDS